MTDKKIDIAEKQYSSEGAVCPYCHKVNHVESEDYSCNETEDHCGYCEKRFYRVDEFAVDHTTSASCLLNDELHKFSGSGACISCAVCGMTAWGGWNAENANSLPTFFEAFYKAGDHEGRAQLLQDWTAKGDGPDRLRKKLTGKLERYPDKDWMHLAYLGTTWLDEISDYVKRKVRDDS